MPRKYKQKFAKIKEFSIAVNALCKCPYCKGQDEYLIYYPDQDSVHLCTTCLKEFKLDKFKL